MRFRDALLDDLPQIVAIYNTTIAGRMVTADTTPVTTESRINWFHAHNPDTRPLWVCEDEKNKMLGWVSYQDFYGRPAYNGTAEISIYLDETSRGKGIGKKILQHAISQCPGLGIHTLLGFIFAQNKASINLFEKLGFEEWANLKDIAILDGKPCSLKILGLKIQ